jgi:hypothetical protein
MCCQQISGWHPNQNLSGKVLPAYQVLAIEKELRITAAAETGCKLQRTSTATSKGRTLNSALWATPAKIFDCVVLAWISRICPLALRAETFGGLNL